MENPRGTFPNFFNRITRWWLAWDADKRDDDGEEVGEWTLPCCIWLWWWCRWLDGWRCWLWWRWVEDILIGTVDMMILMLCYTLHVTLSQIMYSFLPSLSLPSSSNPVFLFRSLFLQFSSLSFLPISLLLILIQSDRVFYLNIFQIPESVNLLEKIDNEEEW